MTDKLKGANQMESSREDQIMELFDITISSYHSMAIARIMESGVDVDKELTRMEDSMDEKRARMTSLVYGKGEDTE